MLQDAPGDVTLTAHVLPALQLFLLEGIRQIMFRQFQHLKTRPDLLRGQKIAAVNAWVKGAAASLIKIIRILSAVKKEVIFVAIREFGYFAYQVSVSGDKNWRDLPYHVLSNVFF